MLPSQPVVMPEYSETYFECLIINDKQVGLWYRLLYVPCTGLCLKIDHPPINIAETSSLQQPASQEL
jgi:hypothetical protein